MDANGLVHINWGWGGNCDAYFQVSVMDPVNQGAGGSLSNYAYTYRVCGYTHIQPNQNGMPRYTFLCGEMTIESERIARNETPYVRLDTLQNLALYEWSGSRALLLYQNDQLVQVCADDRWASLPPYYYYYSLYVRPSLAEVPVGDYTVVPTMAVDNQPGVYEPVYQRGKGVCSFPMRVTADSILLGSAAPTPEPQALDNIPTEQVGHKYLEHGHVIIEKNGVRYNVLGTEVKKK